MTYTDVSHCGNDHAEWLKSIDFYKGEFNILNKRLQEVAQKNTSADAMAWVEHFQNQFVVQRNNMDELKHSIHVHEDKVATDSREHAGKIETGLVKEHVTIREQLENHEKIIKELRQEFNQFLSKWM